jgi:hypothetical protein
MNNGGGCYSAVVPVDTYNDTYSVVLALVLAAAVTGVRYALFYALEFRTYLLLLMPWPWGNPADDEQEFQTCPYCGAVDWELLGQGTLPSTESRLFRRYVIERTGSANL